MEDRTKDLAERYVQKVLEQGLNPELDEDGNTIHPDINHAVKIMEVLNTSEQILEKWNDDSSRRKIEAEKKASEERIETGKQKISWVQAGIKVFEIAVIICGYVAYDKFQKRVLDFEENGRITSTAGRDLHLPRFMK